jgi:hypothetical protein
VNVWPGSVGDTLVVIYVPYLPEPTPAHVLLPPDGVDNPLPPGGTCGSRCLDLLMDEAAELEIVAGDMLRLQVAGERRLLFIEEVVETSDTSFTVRFSEIEEILQQPAALSDDLRLDRFSTFVQKLTPIIFYVDEEEQLYRATALNPDGSPIGHVMAYGVERFDVKLVFADGDELDRADVSDGDDTNDYDDIAALKLLVTLKADRVDPRVNDGEVLRRDFEWTISPRNLRYERN